jgi:hypothetical protein
MHDKNSKNRLHRSKLLKLNRSFTVKNLAFCTAVALGKAVKAKYWVPVFASFGGISGAFFAYLAKSGNLLPPAQVFLMNA